MQLDTNAPICLTRYEIFLPGFSFLAPQLLLVWVYCMWGPGRFFFFQCGLGEPEVWTPALHLTPWVGEDQLEGSLFPETRGPRSSSGFQTAKEQPAR